MVEDVGEGGVEVTFQLDLWEDGGGPVGCGRKGLYLISAVSDDFFSVAFEENLAHELRLLGLCIWEVPWAFEGLGQGEMLLCDGPTRYSLVLMSVLRLVK